MPHRLAPSLVLATALSWLPAQAGPPVFVAVRDPIVSLRAEGVDALVDALPGTALGRLGAEPEVAQAFTRLFDTIRARVRRREVMVTEAARLGVDLEPWQLVNLLNTPDPWVAFRHPLDELRRFELSAPGPGEDADSPNGGVVVALACRPQFEGRWTREFEQEAAALAAWPWVRRAEEQKVAGYPGHVFRVPEGDEQEQFGLGPAGRWMLHLPGTFLTGSGAPERVADIGTADTPPPAGLSLRMDLQQYVRMFERMGFGIPPEFQALGFDQLKHLEWRARFAGELVLDELEVALHGEPRGLVAALVTGSAALPPQALPDGAIVQLRCAVDLPLLLDAVAAMSDDLPPIPDAVRKDVVAAFDGSIAIGLTAPPTGGLIPRMFVSAGVADDAALQRLLALLDEQTRAVKFGEVEARVAEIPGAPQGLQPSFCVVGRTLHVAESGLSMRAFLKAQGGEATAMDVGDAPTPEGPGDPLPGFDLRFDEVALFRAYRDVWLPAFEALGGVGGATPAFRRDDLPDVDVVAQHLRKSRGVLRRDGDGYVVQHLGPLGGPELAALLLAWGPILSSAMNDYAADQIAHAVATRKLEAAWQALSRFQKREQRWPSDLAELFAAEKLAADALLLPGDDLAEPLTLADGKQTRSSFRYFPTPVAIAELFFDGENKQAGVLLIEVQSRPYNRAMLAADGAVPEVYGDASSAPIDSFGK